MTTSDHNPCLGCSTNQHCCSKLSGLFLAEKEFLRHFQAHEAQLEVVWTGKTAVITVRDGGPCPHWTASGCRVYLDRPIDCRVFPYVITQVIRQGKKVKVTFHTSSDCPKKELLYRMIPQAEIRSLLTALGKRAYGEDAQVIVRHEDEIASRWQNRIKALLRGQWRGIVGKR